MDRFQRIYQKQTAKGEDMKKIVLFCFLLLLFMPSIKVNAADMKDPNSFRGYRNVATWDFVSGDKPIALAYDYKWASLPIFGSTTVAVIPANTKLATIKYQFGAGRDDRIINGKYYDGCVFKYTVSPIQISVYLYGLNKYEEVFNFPKDASDIIATGSKWKKGKKVSLNVATDKVAFYSFINLPCNMPYQLASNNNIIYNGGDITDYTPRRDKDGSTDYKIKTFKSGKDLLNTILNNITLSTKFVDTYDRTDIMTGVYNTEYDYRLWDSLGNISQDRFDTVYRQDTRSAGLYWYCTDSSYAQPIKVTVDITAYYHQDITSIYTFEEVRYFYATPVK